MSVRARRTKWTRRAASLAVASSLFAASPRAGASGYVFATFTGDTTPGEKLSIYTSTDGLHFTLLSNTGFGGPTGWLRDPSIIKYADGKYYVAYTDPVTPGCCGKEDHFSIAVSSDLVHWTHLTTVNAGVPGVAHTWAPEWFDDDGTIKIIANIDTLNTDSDFKPYIFTAQSGDLTRWSGAAPLGIGPNYIDTFVLKLKGTYHVFAKNETTRYAEHATASSLTGPWTFVGTGNWAGWGAGMEGPCVVQLDDGSWEILLDGQGSTPFLYATSRDLNSWSGVMPLPGISNLVRHGTVIRDSNASGPPADGGTAMNGLDGGRAPDDAGSGGGVDGARVDDGALAFDGQGGVDGDAAAVDGAGRDDARPTNGGGPAKEGGGTGLSQDAANDGSDGRRGVPPSEMDAALADGGAADGADVSAGRSIAAAHSGGCSCRMAAAPSEPWTATVSFVVFTIPAIRRRRKRGVGASSRS